MTEPSTQATLFYAQRGAQTRPVSAVCRDPGGITEYLTHDEHGALDWWPAADCTLVAA